MDLPSLDQRMAEAAAKIEPLLDSLLSDQSIADELARPRRLLEAMRYATLQGGKRVRPFLVMEFAKVFGVSQDHALMAGAATECIHCFSLVHDDLPELDDDDTRRGRPTTHIAFDPATALLAGDALLAFAFDLLSRPDTHPDPAVRLSLVNCLARSIGAAG